MVIFYVGIALLTGKSNQGDLVRPGEDEGKRNEHTLVLICVH